MNIVQISFLLGHEQLQTTMVYLDITLEQEYAKVMAVFGWQAQDFAKCSLAALEASFISKEIKQ